MSQSIMESLFGDDLFFEDSCLLWPRRGGLTERFLRRREQMMESLRADVGDRLINELFQSLDELFSSPSSSTPSSTSTAGLTGPSVFSLDARGFSPEDIGVTVRGRKLEVKVAKPGETDSSAPAGFSRSVELPDHVDPSTLTCTLGDDGFLKIESRVREAEADKNAAAAAAAAPAAAAAADAPVLFRTSLDFPLGKDSTSKTEEKND